MTVIGSIPVTALAVGMLGGLPCRPFSVFGPASAPALFVLVDPPAGRKLAFREPDQEAMALRALAVRVHDAAARPASVEDPRDAHVLAAVRAVGPLLHGVTVSPSDWAPKGLHTRRVPR